MQTEQPLSNAPASRPALRRPASAFGRASGLYGEVVTLPVSGRGMAMTAERKASM